jgi:hypothetical protein
VFITEGEKHVDRLRELGLVATTSPMGAGKWKDEYAGWLKGRHVVILPDNDDPGQSHAAKVGRSLHGVAKSVRMLELPGLDYKGDVLNWLALGHTAEELMDLARKVPEWDQSVNDDSVYSGDSVQGWELPQPFASVEVPYFPISALPADLAEYVSQEAEAKQVPIDLPGCLSLGAASAAGAHKAKVYINDDWIEPLNLFEAVALPSGERKSPEFRAFFKPLEDREQELAKEMAPEILKLRTELDILEARWRNAKAEAAKRPEQKGDPVKAESEARELAEEVSKFVVPAVPRLLADDATPEAVAALLAEQNGRLAIASAEGGIFDIIAGRYSDGAPNLDVYLKGYSGDTLRVDRRSRPPEFVPNPCLTVVLTVQPDVIRSLADNPTFRNRGFTARWLFVLPQSMVGFRSVNPCTVEPKVRERWDRIVRAILELPNPEADGTPLIHLSPGAQEKFQAWRTEVETALRPGADLDDLADWGNKLCGNTARLAGLLHILEWALNCVDCVDSVYAPSYSSWNYPWDRPVALETMQSAIALGRYFREHAKAAFALMEADPELAAAKQVWAAIERHQLTQFSLRDLWQRVRRRFSRVEHLQRVLEKLATLGHVRRVLDPGDEKGRGRPPSPVFEVNPLARTRGTQNTQKSGSEEAEVGRWKV